jgi:DNA primase
VPGIDYKTLRSTISISQVLDLASFVRVEKAGDHVRGACPFHVSSGRKERSFSVKKPG